MKTSPRIQQWWNKEVPLKSRVRESSRANDTGWRSEPSWRRRCWFSQASHAPSARRSGAACSLTQAWQSRCEPEPISLHCPSSPGPLVMDQWENSLLTKWAQINDIWLILGAMKQKQNGELRWGGAAMELGWPGKTSQRWRLLSWDVNEQKRQQVKIWGKKIPGRGNLRWVGWIWRTERSQCGRAWWTLGWAGGREIGGDRRLPGVEGYRPQQGVWTSSSQLSITNKSIEKLK